MKSPELSQEEESLIKALRASRGAELSPDAKDRIWRSILSASVTGEEERRWNVQEAHHAFTFSPMMLTIILAIVLAAGAGTAVAADNAKPGERLFGVDRAMEQVRLTLALSAESKAQVAADIAEEREEERAELEVEQKVAVVVEEAEEHVDRALEQAQETVARVRSKLEANANPGKAADALEKVEEKLAVLKERHEERIKEAARGLTEVEMTLHPTSGYTTVELEINDVKSNFRLETTDVDAIVKEIAKRTGVSERVIRSMLEMKAVDVPPDEEDEEDDAPDANVPSETGNANLNVNAEVEVETRANVNVAIDNGGSGNADARRWIIEVRVEDDSTRIKTRFGDDRQEWTVQSSDRTAIANNIAQRTGLAASAVTAVWKFEVETE